MKKIIILSLLFIASFTSFSQEVSEETKIIVNQLIDQSNGSMATLEQLLIEYSGTNPEITPAIMDRIRVDINGNPKKIG